MKLKDLEATFLKHEVRIDTWLRQNPDGSTEEVTGPRDYFQQVFDIKEAQGIEFLCPCCFEKNQGNVGTHVIICWFKDRGIPDTLHPKPGRWIPEGTNLDNLSFVGPGAASVLLTGGCNWHGFIRNGETVNA